MIPSVSVLQRAIQADVETAPYPHLVLRNALPAALYAELAASFPTPAALGVPARADNARWSYSLAAASGNAAVPDLWREFLAYHASEAFFRGIIALFGDHIRALHPARFADPRVFERMRAGIRGRDGFDRAEILLDAQLAGNTPAITASAVRSTHVDDGDKLFSGLFYMRDPADDSVGGELEIRRFLPQFADADARRRLYHGKFVDAAGTEVVKRVPYAANTLVLLLNSTESLHGVTVRQPTPHPRRFVNLLGEVTPGLYHLDPAGAADAAYSDRRS